MQSALSRPHLPIALLATVSVLLAGCFRVLGGAGDAGGDGAVEPTDADLPDTDLHDADLHDADLHDADLGDALDAGVDSDLELDAEGDADLTPDGDLDRPDADDEVACADDDDDGHEATYCGGDDCEDSNRSIHPGAPELCDGLDNNCDDEVDEVCSTVTDGLIFHVDASLATGTGLGGDGCPGAASSNWVELVTDSGGELMSFATPPCEGSSGWHGSTALDDPPRLSFDGIDDYIRFASPYRARRFTLEVWLQHQGNGTPTSTGTGGIDLEPVLSQGRAEEEYAEIDHNYILGIWRNTGSGGARAAIDFEAASDSQNYPLVGEIAIEAGVWHQIVVTHDEVTRRIYVNGVLDVVEPMTVEVAHSGISPTALGTSLDSTGLSPEGYFRGSIAIARIYSRALDAAEVEQNCEAQAWRFGLSCPAGL